MQAIPWSAIKDYADAMEIEGEQRDDLFYFVRSMDLAFLSYHESKHKAQTKKPALSKKL